MRKYAKLCAVEGIQSDRVNIGDQRLNTKTNTNVKKGREEKVPFAQALKARKEKEEIKSKEDNEKLQKKAEIEKANKLREEKRKRHLTRTKKGQPVLSHQIKDILHQLTTKNGH